MANGMVDHTRVAERRPYKSRSGGEDSSIERDGGPRFHVSGRSRLSSGIGATTRNIWLRVYY